MGETAVTTGPGQAVGRGPRKAGPSLSHPQEVITSTKGCTKTTQQPEEPEVMLWKDLGEHQNWEL